jgi:hypothetical protein
MSRPIPKDNDVQSWCSDFLDTSQAELCVRYALAFNTFDVGWLEDTLSHSVRHTHDADIHRTQSERARESEENRNNQMDCREGHRNRI